MIRITKSEKRSKTPKVIELAENTTLTTWGAIKVNNSHFFPSSFRIISGEIVIYIDPVEVNYFEKADYIFITHSHPDHFSLKDIVKLIKANTVIICSKGVSKRLRNIAAIIHIVNPGDKLEFLNLKAEATPAYNTGPVFLWIKAHPKSKKNVGFIITLNNGFRVYHGGDTDYLPEMKGIANIDLALIPIGGDKLTMNVEDASLIVNQIKPVKVVPMHYEVLKSEDLIRFKSLINESIGVIEFE